MIRNISFLRATIVAKQHKVTPSIDCDSHNHTHPSNLLLWSGESKKWHTKKPAPRIERGIFSLQVRCVTTAPYGPTYQWHYSTYKICKASKHQLPWTYEYGRKIQDKPTMASSLPTIVHSLLIWATIFVFCFPPLRCGVSTICSTLWLCRPPKSWHHL